MDPTGPAGSGFDPDFVYAHFAQVFWLAFERGTLGMPREAALLAGAEAYVGKSDLLPLRQMLSETD